MTDIAETIETENFERADVEVPDADAWTESKVDAMGGTEKDALDGPEAEIAEVSEEIEAGYSEERMKAIAEGVLFTMGSSVSKDDLALALKTTPAHAAEIAEALMTEYSSEKHGLAIIRLDNSFQMCTKEFCFEPLVRVAAHPKKPVLTDVVLETLSIIAYRQPVTKLEISKIRGVSSDHAVNKLIEYGLIAERGRLNAPGRPILFGTTEEFLRRFKLESLDELPIPAPDRIAEIQNEVASEYPDSDTDAAGGKANGESAGGAAALKAAVGKWAAAERAVAEGTPDAKTSTDNEAAEREVFEAFADAETEDVPV